MDQEKMGAGEKLGGVEGGETIIRIYCMRKESSFNKKEKKLNNFQIKKTKMKLT